MARRAVTATERTTRWRPPQFRKLYDLLGDGVPCRIDDPVSLPEAPSRKRRPGDEPSLHRTYGLADQPARYDWTRSLPGDGRSPEVGPVGPAGKTTGA